MTDICAGHDRVLYVLRQLFVGDAAVDDVIRHVAHGHFAVDFVRRDDVDVGIAFQGMADIVCRFRRLQLQDLVDIAVAVPDGDIPAGLRRRPGHLCLIAVRQFAVIQIIRVFDLEELAFDAVDEAVELVIVQILHGRLEIHRRRFLGISHLIGLLHVTRDAPAEKTVQEAARNQAQRIEEEVLPFLPRELGFLQSRLYVGVIPGLRFDFNQQGFEILLPVKDTARVLK